MPIPRKYMERLSPRLRMIVNGDDEVNAHRSEMSGAVVTPPELARRYRVEQALVQAEAAPAAEAPLPEPPGQEALETDVRVSCFLQFEGTGNRKAVRRAARPGRRQLAAAVLSPTEIAEILERAEEEGVLYIEAGSPLSLPRPAVVRRTPDAPPSRVPMTPVSAIPGEGMDRGRVLVGESRHPIPPREHPAVLIGLVDVGGFDFSHPDFLVEREVGGETVRETRFEVIWDQGATRGRKPRGLPYGALIHREEMNAAIAAAPEVGVAATDLVSQSVQVPGSHGTHVASVAAGSSGVCPDAMIAAVLISLTEEEQARHRTFYDSGALAHAVDFLFDLGQEKGLPTVINVSLGTNGHAHDGTSPISRWIETALDEPGRCVCVAAGNAGQDAPQFEGDLGFLMGRIHASGRVPARGLAVDLEWQVVGNGIVDVSENELEIWYEAGDELAVSVRPPSGDWIGPVRLGEYIENLQLPSETFLSVYSERYHPANGANRISIFLSPRLKDRIVGIEAGRWTVRLHGVEVRDGRFDAWIERDDPRPLGRLGESQAWRFPSYFTARTNVDRSSVSSIACGHRVISVANGDERGERINPSSSQGPTRDGRNKPDIAAPGTDIVAARGFSGPDRPWISMTGTSMATPYVTGVAAQMLALEPRLTATQILGMLRRTARPLPGSTYEWRNDAGFGRIDPEHALAQVCLPFAPLDLEAREEKKLGRRGGVGRADP